MNEQIQIRMYALKYNLVKLRDAYDVTLRDAFIEVGLKYDTEYEENEFMKKDTEYRKLKRERELVLFTCILNFTQCFYSIKEYLKKIYPQYYESIEEFFNQTDDKGLSRKVMAIDLKHNPHLDVHYAFKQVKKETIRSPKKVVHKIEMKHSWFYKNVESVDYCTRLFSELEEFIDNNSKYWTQ